MNADLVRELFDYDPKTGAFTRLKSTTNSVRVGDVAGSLEKSGYRRVNVGGKHYRVHRLIWLWVYGVWPSKLIDHRDRDRSNNRLLNLRDVTTTVNSENKGIQGNNTTGVPGVHFYKSLCCYQAYIGVRGRRVQRIAFLSCSISVCTNRLLKAWWARSALRGASTTSA